MRAPAAVLSVLILAATALGQVPAFPEPIPPADDTVRELLVEFDRMFNSLRNNGGVQENNLDMLRAFDERVAAAGSTRPADRHLLAVRVQVATWLKDDDLMDEAYRRLVVFH